ncbi:unnamed protein product, partial [Didymodactylos carnosus]
SGIAGTYSSIAETYEIGFQDYDNALEHYKKVLNKYENATLPEDEVDIIDTRRAVDRVMRWLHQS